MNHDTNTSKFALNNRSTHFQLTAESKAEQIGGHLSELAARAQRVCLKAAELLPWGTCWCGAPGCTAGAWETHSPLYTCQQCWKAPLSPSFCPKVQWLQAAGRRGDTKVCKWVRNILHLHGHPEEKAGAAKRAMCPHVHTSVCYRRGKDRALCWFVSAPTQFSTRSAQRQWSFHKCVFLRRRPNEVGLKWCFDARFTKWTQRGKVNGIIQRKN